MNLYEKYQKEIRAMLLSKLGKKNVHQVPKIDKIIVSIGIGSLHTRKSIKDFSDLEKNLASITGQKPMMIKSRKSIANFKLREGMPSMLMVTLRGKRAYDFVDKMINTTLPRVRDFDGINPKSFDKNGNYSLGFKDQSVFVEIGLDDLKTSCGVGVTISMNTDSVEDNKVFMKDLGFIFRGDIK